jgi:hypothetical protein
VSRFEVRDGRVVLELTGADVRLLDAMAHRYAWQPASAHRASDVERLRDLVCRALDAFYLGEDGTNVDED